MPPLRDLNEMLKAIDGLAIRTTQGSYVKVSDLLDLMERYQGEGTLQQTGKFDTFAEAKKAAKSDPELQAAFASKKSPTEVAIEAAMGRHSPTATEGVKP
jgi:hypothetical protein